MSSYGNGYGTIIFRDILTDKKIKKITGMLDGILDYHVIKMYSTKENTYSTAMEIFSIDEYYYEDDIKEVLEKIADCSSIRTGEIVYVGEYDSVWRFVYFDKQWLWEEGKIKYIFPSNKEGYEKEI